MTSKFDLIMTNTEYYLQSIKRVLVVSQNLCLVRSLEEITKIILPTVREITNSDGATFVILDHGFSYYVDENAISPLWKGQRFPVDADIAGSVMLTGKPSLIEDISTYQTNYRHFNQDTFIKSLAIVPIIKNGSIGAIGTYWQDQHQITDAELQLLELLAQSTAVAMENLQAYSQLERQLSDRTNALELANKRLRQEIQKSQTMAAEIRHLSLTDELTGLNNMRGFLLLAEQQLRLGKRSKINTKLMFFTINELAETKEHFGDDIFNDTIVMIAKLLKKSFRASDTLGRISEDKFVVLIQADRLACDIIKDRVQTNLDQYNQTHNLPFSIQLKITIQSYNYYTNMSLEDLIRLEHIPGDDKK